MPEAEQTKSGNYEFISYHLFGPVDYTRKMSWKAGSGRIGMGVIALQQLRASVAGEDVELPAGQTVIVTNMEFKLCKAWKAI
ncbi:hypothetical protein N3K66_001285 [Trichothecium roseum]|uniref:Uncharacterized protein n=1 Tax=Trichothecium roseum TaxID=47278 RepID=A0ACC0VEA4_9HYPO|nr:hypothetical protein N3K66_001285 [Trichothecium roseum]